jgi:hypothetical protein
MTIHRKAGNAAAVAVRATAFRSDRSAVPVVITELSFDGCLISTGARFDIGERLRLHLPGQGCIEAEVERASGDEAWVTYLTECRV